MRAEGTPPALRERPPREARKKEDGTVADPVAQGHLPREEACRVRTEEQGGPEQRWQKSCPKEGRGTRQEMQ